MTPDEVCYRRCQVPDCEYKEIRGSRQGDFVHGQFVCPAHFAARDELLDLAKRAFARSPEGEPR